MLFVHLYATPRGGLGLHLCQTQDIASLPYFYLGACSVVCFFCLMDVGGPLTPVGHATAANDE